MLSCVRNIGLSPTLSTMNLNSKYSGLVFHDSSGQESLELKSLFLQETVKRGILFGGPVYISFSHTNDDIEQTVEASFEALRVVRKAIGEVDIDKYMEGKKIGTVYRTRD